MDLIGKTCTCPDYTFRGVTCKHVLAASLAAKAEAPFNGVFSEV